MRRGVVLAAAGVCNALVGAIYMWSIFNIPLAETYGWSFQATSAACSLYIVCECIAGFAVGWLQTRVRSNLIVLAGGCCFALGWFCAGLAHSLPALYFLYSVVGGMGSGCLYNVSVSTATAWFPDKRGFANGVCIGCTGLSPLVFAPMGNALIETFNVGTAFNACGALFGICVLAAWWFVQAPPVVLTPPASDNPKAAADRADGNALQANGEQSAAPLAAGRAAAGRAANDARAESGQIAADACPSEDLALPQMLRQPVAWTMWIMLAVSVSAGMMVTGHASGIGQELAGLTAGQAAAQVGIFAVANFTGRLAFGLLSDRFGRFPMLAVAMAVTAFDMLVLFGMVHDFALLTVALCLAGMCFGGVMSIVPPLTADLFGPRYFGQNYAFMFSGYTCASIVGPMLGATVLETTGSYAAAFPIAGALSCAGLAVMAVAAFMARGRTAR